MKIRSVEKNIFDKLAEECTEGIDEIEIASENEHKNKGSSCTLYIHIHCFQ